MVKKTDSYLRSEFNFKEAEMRLIFSNAFADKRDQTIDHTLGGRTCKIHPELDRIDLERLEGNAHVSRVLMGAYILGQSNV